MVGVGAQDSLEQAQDFVADLQHHVVPDALGSNASSPGSNSVSTASPQGCW